MTVVIAAVLILAISIFHPTVNAWAISLGQSSTPESFSTLAETVSPAVVNIRTVKTIKGGGPVFRHFHQRSMGGSRPV